jgi:hypothetical protein
MTRPPATSALAGEFAALCRWQPLVIARLLAEHTDDGTGHCRVCTSGAQTGRQLWPCLLRGLAEEANTLAKGMQ